MKTIKSNYGIIFTNGKPKKNGWFLVAWDFRNEVVICTEYGCGSHEGFETHALFRYNGRAYFYYATYWKNDDRLIEEIEECERKKAIEYYNEYGSSYNKWSEHFESFDNYLKALK
jgi:hypothetical protein